MKPAKVGESAIDSAEVELNEIKSRLESAGLSAAKDAIRAGEIYTQKKSELKHGEWLPWIEKHSPFSQVHVNRFMHAYRVRDKLNTDVFNFRQADKLLPEGKTRQKRERAPKPPKSAQSVKALEKLLRETQKRLDQAIVERDKAIAELEKPKAPAQSQGNGHFNPASIRPWIAKYANACWFDVLKGMEASHADFVTLRDYLTSRAYESFG